jgi:hypothetical protein
MMYANWIVADVYEEYGHDTILTSGREGVHMPGSKHYSGNAGDYRIRHLEDSSMAAAIVEELRGCFTDDYDVVLEETHIHVEYDPK